ncbi:DUF397 domain-containing protein [Streptomyces sp. PSKA30]|uniref:DUF397 domain-containing protein n=1 Tax=Streptomyces sp. PSKA30 TaxID=2874597 RepID=UPI001CD19467|nr:DUF397 domain-containing protein [Streptomyces sp. PSKA30]MBZ9644124.1 DUF397 domain-containing protein [Streptomyces sp. PSKA30]
MTARSTPHWFKSSYSGGSGTECVECAGQEQGTLIRDSKQADGPVVAVGHLSWRVFIGALEQGELRGSADRRR